MQQRWLSQTYWFLKAGGLSPAETSFVNFMQEIVIMYIYLKYK